MFRMPSDDDEGDATVIKKDDRRASCPIFGCHWKTQKIRNHVNRMHLHRVVWNNPNPSDHQCLPFPSRIREGTSRLSGSVMKSNPKSRYVSMSGPLRCFSRGYLIPPVDQHTDVVRRVQGIPIVHAAISSLLLGSSFALRH
jgi:hypothetical protein